MKEIIIIGLGPGSFAQLSMGAWQSLNGDKPIYFRTEKHPVIRELAEKGIQYHTFDYLYQEKESFDLVYESIVEELINKLAESDSIIYGVPGHPLVGEDSVSLLINKAREKNIKFTLIPSMSFIDSLINVLQVDPIDGFSVVDALSFNKKGLDTTGHIIFTQVFNRLVASDLKLLLLEIYPYDHPVVVIRGAGIPGEEKLEKTMVSDMDHLDWFDHLTSVYVAPLDEGIKIEGINKDIFQEKYPLDPLVNVMDELLSPGGCPWDREQDHLSLKPYLIEETYEVIEAIDCLNMDKLREELGDLLLQIVFHAALAQRRGDFDLNNVIEEITAKMIRRHPHVFGEVTVNDSNDVLKNWEQIKKEEKGNNIKRDRIMGTLNRSLPSLLMAEEVQKKAKKVGFDWQDIQGPLNKVKEEFAELEEVLSEEFRSGEGKIKAEDELGDLLFSVVNLARFIRISPEAALYKTVQKFIRRFNYIEDEITKNNTNWDQMDLKSLDNLWEMAKIKGL